MNRRTKSLLRRYILAIIVILSLTFVFYSNTLTTVVSTVNVADTQDYTSGLKHASPVSPFSYVNNYLLNSEKTRTSTVKKLLPFLNKPKDGLVDWNSSSKYQKCLLLVKSMYKAHPHWSNRDIMTAYDNESVEDLNLQLAGERIKIYKQCFLDNDIEPIEFFKRLSIPDVDAYDFQKRMFYFFRDITASNTDYFHPAIKNVKSGEVVSKPKTKLTPQEYNANIIGNWRKLSRGKGIVLTVSQSDVPLLRQQFRVWKELGNKLPIQVVHKGTEINAELEQKIKEYAIEMEQDVYVVDLSPVIDPDFAENSIQNFHNKWYAAIFNTFEELILIDADAIPYVPAEDFLKSKSYKKTGLRLWRDRDITHERTLHFCVEMAPYFEPTLEEHNLIGTTLSYRLTDSGLKDAKDSEGRALYEFFQKMYLHHVDSGLVVIDKKDKIHSLIMSEILHSHTRFGRCTYGDKELFMLGAYMVGESYTLEAQSAAIIGTVGYEKEFSRHYICATQMGHSDEDNRLLWSNGGLRTCKFDCAEEDFNKDEEYYKKRYQNLDNLKAVYSSRLNIDGFIIPDTTVNKWLQLSECRQYMYCAHVDDNREKDKGTLVRLTDEEKQKVNRISEFWNSAKI
ncbi:Mannosyltransferase putative [Nakaseomyces glabratus]